MSASAKTSAANAQAMRRRTSPSSTVSPSTCSNRTNLPNAGSKANGSKPPGTNPICSNCLESDMRRPCSCGYCMLLDSRQQRPDSMFHRIRPEHVHAASIPSTKSTLFTSFFANEPYGPTSGGQGASEEPVTFLSLLLYCLPKQCSLASVILRACGF